MWWIADILGYRDSEDFVRAYKGTEVIWDKDCRKIFYTSTSGNIIEPSGPLFGANIVSNTYTNGVGVIEFDGPVTDLGADSFIRTDLRTIVIPLSVTDLGGYTFGATDLVSLYIPSSINMVYNQPVIGITDVSSITVNPNNQRYDSRDNCNAVIETNRNALRVGCKNTVIPSSVIQIDWWAFSYCRGLNTITIPSSVRYIADYAFYGSDLQDLRFENGSNLEEIGIDAFYDTRLSFVYIPSSVTKIGVGAFTGCPLTGIEVASNNTFYNDGNGSECLIETATNRLIQGSNGSVIPSTVSSISSDAFYGLDIYRLNIPSSVTNIGGAICGHNRYLTSITVDSNNQIYDSRDNCNCIIETATNKLIQGCNGSTIPSTVTEIGNGAFIEFTGLTSITIPSSLTKIGWYGFKGCTGLTSITIPSSVTEIGLESFSGCTGLTSITIPSSVTSIGGESFVGCTGLTSITVDSNNQIYDSRDNCNAVIETDTNTLKIGCKNTVIPSSVTSIGDYAFAGCTGLTSITIPSSVTDIGVWTFTKCTGLTSITIPSSVTEIGMQTFSGCTGLTSITIPSSVTYIGWAAFEDCTNLSEVIVNCTIPPRFNLNESLPFNHNDVNRVFRVPVDSLRDYLNAPGWSFYADHILPQ